MEDKLEKLKKKNDLSDIILEKDSSSNERIKKLLLGAASLVLLFLIILIVMKMFNNSNISPNENLAYVGEQVTTLDESLLTDNLEDDAPSSLFKEEPIINETSDTDLKFEEMVRRLKQQDSAEDQFLVDNDKEKDLTTISDDSKDENIVDKIKDITSDSIQTSAEKIQTTLEQIKPQVEPVEIVQTPIEVKPVTVIKPKPVIIQANPIREATTQYPISTMNGYFIQVGATYKSFPTKDFLMKIKNSGYDYVVHKVSVKGRDIKKVLVGPYGTRDQARDDLNDVKTKINPSAYIYRIR